MLDIYLEIAFNLGSDADGELACAGAHETDYPGFKFGLLLKHGPSTTQLDRAQQGYRDNSLSGQHVRVHERSVKDQSE